MLRYKKELLKSSCIQFLSGKRWIQSGFKQERKVRTNRKAIVMAALSASGLLSFSTYGGDWTQSAAGSSSWLTDSNWTNPATAPNAPGAVANFNTLDLTVNPVIT